jgi:cyclophilin family peptidyl-prolyl cis-trans isomerase
MSKGGRLFSLIAFVACFGGGARGLHAQEPRVQLPTTVQPTAPGNDLKGAKDVSVRDAQALLANPTPEQIAAAAKAEFDKAFAEYKDAIRKIEQLRVDYQSADQATRNRINNELTGHLAHAQGLMNTVVETAEESFRLAPKSDQRVTDLLVAVAKFYAVGEQIGPPETKPGAGGEYAPISGGDQFEKALPIIKRLIDGGVDNRDLPLWGFLSAFIVNDYDLADEYLKKAQENGSIQALVAIANDRPHRQNGAAVATMNLVESYSKAIPKYRELWEQELAKRSAEEKTDNLPRVKFETTKGEITIELFENEAPQAVANFITLVKQGFYTNSPFHRVLPKFMAQGGAKTDEGEGGPGYTIRCECYKPDYRHHFRGSLSMAHAGRDTGNSQFFLTTVPTTHLDGRHTVFGRVIDGIEVLAELQRRSPEHQMNPPPADRILKAEVLRDRGHAYSFEKLPE